METSFWNDQPILNAAQDRFDFLDYADALSDIVLQAHTPITLGLFGPWGTGKTSLMRLLAGNLLGRRTEEHRRTHIVWFNAWQYERDKCALWRSLLLRVLEGLQQLELSPEDKQRIEDWEGRLYADVKRKQQGSLEIDWPKLGKGALHLGLSLVPSPENLKEWLTLLEGDLSTVQDVTKAFHRKEIEIHRRQLKFLEEFQSGFAHLVGEYIWRRNALLVICVDDLDRCLPDHALEVLETIKIFLDAPGCVFLLAADHKRIEDVIRARYGSQDEGLGESYLEKLVQLPFYLPPLEEDQLLHFLADAAPDLPAEVSRVFTAGLAPNPRMVKRTLNIFSLLQVLAQKRASRGLLEPVEPVLLAKLVVIQTRFRELYHDLLEYPNLIHELELLATGREEILPLVATTEPAATSLVERYTSSRPLMRMLRVGTPFANLTPTQIAAYIHLSLPTSYETATETRPSQRLFNDFLSGDRTRIRAAVGMVRQQQKHKQREYRAALLPFLTGERVASWPQRLSAGWALGYLGDARDFAAVLEIPGGEFSYGEAGDTRYLPGYRIGKYPVTNAQYVRFLETHPELPAPFVDADWAHPYNWDPESRRPPEGRGNQPVVLVTLREAQSYCEWVGGRLPTEEEWERAARGDDGRTFPWGEVANPAYANSRESGLGGLTPVGLYLEGASPYGLLDMAGNVWEWTSSDFDAQTKVIRGGAWNFSLESARTWVRECSRPDNRSYGIGFRVAFDLPADGD